MLAHPVWVILGLAGLFFLPVLAGGTFYAFDVLYQHPPWLADVTVQNRLITDPVNVFFIGHQTFQAAVSEGAWPYWSSLLGGSPASAYSASPFQLVLFSLLPITTAHDLLLFIHVVGSGVAAFVYLRLLVSTPSALIGGITWMFNGYLMVWLQFENAYMIGMTLPMSLYFIEKWLESASAIHVLGAAIGLSLATCSGYAHLFIFQMLFTGVYVGCRILMLMKDPADMLKLAAGPLLALAISFTTGALFYTTHLSWQEEGQRSESSYETFYADTGKLAPHYLLTYLFPDFFGSHKAEHGYFAFPPKPDARKYTYNNYNELNLYTGVLPLLLALIAIPLCVRHRMVALYTGATAVTLLMAMGTWLFYPFYAWVPGLGLSTPTRVLYLTGFFVAVLAAFGAERLRSGEAQRSTYIVVATTGLIALAVVTLMQFESVQRNLIAGYLSGFDVAWETVQPMISDHFGLTGSVLVKPVILLLASTITLIACLRLPSQRDTIALVMAVVISGDLAWYGLSYNTVSDPEEAFQETPGLAYLKGDPDIFRVGVHPAFMPNTIRGAGLDEVSGYSSFYDPRYGDLLNMVNGTPGVSSRFLNISDPTHPLLGLMNMKYWLQPAGSTPPAGFRKVYDGEMLVTRNPDALPRAFLVPAAVRIDDRDERLARLAAGTRETFMSELIVETATPLTEGAATPIGRDVSTSLSSNHLSFQFSSPQPAYLFVATNYHPSWQASLNGESAEVIRANHAFMAVQVPGGDHQLRLEFINTPYVLATWISIAAWVLLLGVTMLMSVRSAREVKN